MGVNFISKTLQKNTEEGFDLRTTEGQNISTANIRILGSLGMARLTINNMFNAGNFRFINISGKQSQGQERF